jgi:hypothetical protein
MNARPSYRSWLLLPALFSCHLLIAQLPVSREPHHKVIFENKYGRLLEGVIPVNDTTAAHLHAANSVVIFLSHSTFGIQIPGEKPIITTVSPGDMKYVAYGDKPVTHIVWNQTPPVFHFLVAELPKRPLSKPASSTPPPATDSCPTLVQPGVSLQWRQKSVTAYYLDIPGSQPYRLPPSGCARLLIDITGTPRTGSRSLQPDNFVFFPPQSKIELNGHARCILLEIK